MPALLNWVAGFLHSLLAFIIILVPLVVFHEFGHFVFARIFGVKAEIFSIGFGPRLWGRQFGETELRVSAIPMGGYVKLLGEDRDSELSPEDQKRSLHRQKAWKRFFIFFGGPLFNFLLAIFLFVVILAIGEPQVASVVGRVVHGSAAEKAGFRSGDRILSIDGKPIKKFEELYLKLNESPKQSLEFQVMHVGAQDPVQIRVKTSSQAGFSVYGESTPVGEIDGLLPAPRANQTGVSDPRSLAAQAGMKTGTKILKVNQTPLTNWEELESIFAKAPVGSPLVIQFELEKGETKTVTWTKANEGNDPGKAYGLHSSELFVDRVIPKSPAEASGLKAGDRIVAVGNTEIQSFFDLKDMVQKSGEDEGKVRLRWERDGKSYLAEIVPTAAHGRDSLLNKTTQYTVGVVPMLVLAEPTTYVERVWNPFKLVYLATDRVITFCWRNINSLRKILTGDVSVGVIGGPITIGKIAGESLTRGLIAFLTNMAIFSIGLGVLNILPVPILDGGHLLLLGIESIRGKPLTIKQMEIIQSFGLILILALMGIAFRNDLARLIYS